MKANSLFFSWLWSSCVSACPPVAAPCPHFPVEVKQSSSTAVWLWNCSKNSKAASELIYCLSVMMMSYLLFHRFGRPPEYPTKTSFLLLFHNEKRETFTQVKHVVIMFRKAIGVSTRSHFCGGCSFGKTIVAGQQFTACWEILLKKKQIISIIVTSNNSVMVFRVVVYLKRDTMIYWTPF